MPPPASQQPPGPPPSYYGPPVPSGPVGPSKTIAILALVFGGAALLFALIPVAGIFIGGLFGIAGIVLGIIGIFKSHRLMSIIGIALAVLGLIVAIIVTIAVGKAAKDIIEDWPSYEDGETYDAGDGTDPSAPLPAGTEIATGNWQVVISDVVPDATDMVLAEDPSNVAPAAGNQYYMFQVDATYLADGSSVAWGDLLFGVAFNNTVYAEPCGFIPNDLLDAPEVLTDGTATGNNCVAVPSDGVADAMISVEDYWASGQRYFVAPS